MPHLREGRTWANSRSGPPTHIRLIWTRDCRGESDDVVSVPARRDEKLQRAVPLKFVDQEGSYRFYAGKNFVTLRPE